MSDHARSKIAIECLERPSDVRTAGPAENASRNFFQRVGYVFGPNQMRDAAERRAEHKRLNAPQLILKAVHELDQKPAVTVHRAADITEQYDFGFFDPALARDQV